VARQKALKGVRLCVSCQEEVDREEITSLTINRRANKDSQLR
jgi:RNA polymerase-binding transcription factor DksA